MKLDKFSVLICTVASLIAVAPASSVAASATAALSVSVSVLSSSCVVGATGSARGGQAATLQNAQAAVTVACSLTMPYTVNVEPGTVSPGLGVAPSTVQQFSQAGESDAFTATITY